MFTKEQLKEMGVEEIEKLLEKAGWQPRENFLFPDVENADHKLFEKTWEVPLYDYDAWDNKLKKYLEFNDIVAIAWQKDYSGPIYFTYILDVYHKYGAYIIEVESLYNSDLTYPNVPIYEDFDAYIYPEEENRFWTVLEEAVNESLGIDDIQPER